MKKILSLILALAMTLSLFSGINVFAVEQEVLLDENFDDCLFENPKGWSFPKAGAALQATTSMTGKAVKFEDTTLIAHGISNLALGNTFSVYKKVNNDLPVSNNYYGDFMIFDAGEILAESKTDIKNKYEENKKL